MQKKAMFVKVGDVLVPAAHNYPSVVISVTKYTVGSTDYFYLETQPLFGEDISRVGIAEDRDVSCLDPDEAARLYSLHKNGNPQPDPSKVDLSDYEKMTTIVQDLFEGDIVTDNHNIIHAEVLKVETTTVLGVILVTYKRYSDDKIIYDRLPVGARVAIYRKRTEP